MPASRAAVQRKPWTYSQKIHREWKFLGIPGDSWEFWGIPEPVLGCGNFTSLLVSGVPTWCFVLVMCLDRQILFEKELRPLARCFGNWKSNFCKGSMKNLIFLSSYQDSSSNPLVSNFRFWEFLGFRENNVQAWRALLLLRLTPRGCANSKY